MPIEALAQEVLAREMAKDPEQFRAPMSTSRASDGPMRPETLSLIGALADAASTYGFMKTGRGVEENALLAGQSPAVTAASVLGLWAAGKGVRALVRKQAPRLADALAANQGAQQLALSVENLKDRRVEPGSSTGAYHEALVRQSMRGR